MFRERDLVVVGINLPKSDPEESARAFLDEFGISYPNVFDTRGFTAIDYGVSGIPVTFFVDREGVVTRRFVGTLTEGSLISVGGGVGGGITLALRFHGSVHLRSRLWRTGEKGLGWESGRPRRIDNVDHPPLDPSRASATVVIVKRILGSNELVV